MANEFPLLRLELLAAKQTLLTALADRHDDLTKMIEASFANAIEHIKAQLDTQVQHALSEVIADAVDRAASLASKGLADELAEAMASQVREVVKRRMEKRHDA